MTMDHDAIKDALLDRIGDAPLDPEVEAHLDGCAECNALVTALAHVDAGLSTLPLVPDDLIARTLDRIATEEKPQPGVISLFVGLLGALFGGLWTLVAAPFRTRARRWTLGITVPALGAAWLVLFTAGYHAAPERSLELDDVEGRSQQLAYLQEDTSRESTGEDGWIDVPEPTPDDDGIVDEELDRQLHALVYAVDEHAENEETSTDSDHQLAEGDLRAGDVLRDQSAALEEEDGRYWREREITEGLTFQEARGYWANTYVPGDPEHRLLRRRLAGSPSALALAERARPVDLALDPPREGALALSLRADRASVQGRSRVTLAVGLRGADVHGRRPTLSTAVVIDARQPLDSGARERVRALLTALSRGRDSADRASVIVAGPHGGVLVPPGELRLGELSVALDRLESGDAPMSVQDALRTAIATVGDPSAPPSSALVLFVTPALDDGDARSLEPLAHAGALAGVTTSAIGLSDAVSLDAIGRVALSGQGRRLVLATSDDAGRVLASEVSASSRVIARAARLRIRLAPGVSLVDVLGSRRLDDEETARVRAAETAIDRELAQSLGIASDRHGDEDGIQIVIPAFYAGDEHAVLLDLVVEGPGAVADVSLRWKDLARSGNGSAEERLTIGEGASERGPRERSVLMARLGHEVTTALRESARRLEAGDAEAARAEVAQARARIEAMQGALPPSQLARDLELCAAYDAALARGEAALADSLRYASVRRAHGDPIALDGRVHRARAADPPANADMSAR